MSPNMKTRFVLFLMIMAVTPGFLSGQETVIPAEYRPGPGWSLEWSDEFDGPGRDVDTNKWTFETGTLGGGNMELQYYTPTNAYVTGGNLVILTSRIKNVFLSSRISTDGKYSVTFGKIVARIKMPEGKGMWPAFWMLGTNKSSANWPQCGEIDIAEIRGGDQKGDRTVLGSAHWFDDKHLYVTRSKTLDEKLSAGFHDYELEWNPRELVFRIDGMEYHRADISSRQMDEFRQPFYIILNVAVGGMFSRIYSPAGVTAPLPQTTLVDWVRVYKQE